MRAVIFLGLVAIGWAIQKTKDKEPSTREVEFVLFIFIIAAVMDVLEFFKILMRP